MVAVHAFGKPSTAVEIALGNYPAGVQQEYQLAVAIIREIQPEFLQFRFRQDATAVKRLHYFVHALACRFVEKPEPRHGRVVHREIILRYSQAKLRYLPDQVGMLLYRGHTMV